MKFENIENFLIKNGFRIISFEDNIYKFEFDDQKLLKKLDKIWKLQEKVDELDKPSNDKETDDLCIKLYRKIWSQRNKLEKNYYPKLKPLVDALNLFYIDRPLEYRYLIKLHDISINLFYFGRNRNLDENINDNDFKNKMARELQDFDNFLLKNSI
jgi:hypothetical protein